MERGPIAERMTGLWRRGRVRGALLGAALVGVPSASLNGVDAIAETLVNRHSSWRVVGKPVCSNASRARARSAFSHAGAASPRPFANRSSSAR